MSAIGPIWCWISESSSESFAMLIFVSSSCAEKVRVMMICGVDLLGTMTTPGVWVPEQVGSSWFSENSLDKLCILIFTTISHRPKHNFSCTCTNCHVVTFECSVGFSCSDMDALSSYVHFDVLLCHLWNFAMVSLWNTQLEDMGLLNAYVPTFVCKLLNLHTKSLHCIAMWIKMWGVMFLHCRCEHYCKSLAWFASTEMA